MDVLIWLAFVADKAGFTRVEEVKPVRDVDFVVFGLDPCQLVDNFIAPFVHALVSYVHLRVEYPQEAESFRRQIFNGYVDDLLVAHGRILQVEFVI